MSKLHAFYHRLEKYKELNPRADRDAGDYYHDDRHTFCYLILLEETRGVKYARFEVRGWSLPKTLPNGKWMIEVSVVNWTICAGTASLQLHEDNIDKWEILEDNKALQVLIGWK